MDNLDPGELLGLGIFGILISAVVVVSAVALGFWLLYTVIWRAVRRGMREFHYPKQD